jgi:hypothetical protein
MAWIYPLVTNMSTGNVLSTHSGGTLHYLWYPNSTQLSAGHGGNIIARVTDPQQVVANVWVHYAVTYDNETQTMILYRNGSNVSSTTNAELSWTGSTGQLGIGAYGGGLPFNGYLDDVRVFSRALTAQHINTIYTYTNIPVSSGLITYYIGESWTGTQWTDMLGNNHATVVSGTITVNSTGINGRTFISGDTNAVIQFPAAILPSTYTLFHVTRYNGTNRRRIIVTSLDGASAWLSGHWANSTGVAYHGKWINSGNIGHTGFFLSSDQNNLYRSNGVQRGSVISGGSSRNIGINVFAAEKSDWACACVYVYNRTLSLAEMQQMETYLKGLYALY